MNSSITPKVNVKDGVVQLPKGWRWVSQLENLRSGDRLVEYHKEPFTWALTACAGTSAHYSRRYIRRVPAKGKARK